MSVRELFLERERDFLSPYAFKTADTKGRQYPDAPCPNRTDFQRDRDRIIHSKAFRRLMHKTQVFLSPEDEHIRTRMTHTLEVTQIARIIARALALNEDLTEAIALGHDLGHTPFGHGGEEVMRKYFSPDFSHAAQSVRVCEVLERDGKGLNLTWEVRDGILNHSGSSVASTLEGRVVKFADRIAYINHDIDDAIRMGVLSPDAIPKEITAVLGTRHSQRINTMVTSLIEASTGKDDISMTAEIASAMDELRSFLFKNVYLADVVEIENAKAREMLGKLFRHYENHPDELPELYRKNLETETVARCVCDYLSGMTDRYAIELFRELYIPNVWRRGESG